MTNKKKAVNKEQLKLVLGVLAIIIIVSFLFFINKYTSEGSLAGNSVFDAKNQELTVSCNAEALEKIKTYSLDNGCSTVN